MTREGKEKRDRIPFPDCAKGCPMLEIFGCCECESCCPHKFDKDGNPIEIN